MHHAVARAISRRVMRAWLASQATTIQALPQPSGSLSVHAAGDNPVRLLFIGGSVLVGHGVLSADLALQGAIARQVAVATGRGVDAEVIASVGCTAADARRELRNADPTRFDAVVLVLGSMEAVLQASPASWVADMEAILASLEAAEVPVIVPTIPRFTARTERRSSLPRRLADEHAKRLNVLLRHVVSVSPVASLVEFDVSLAGDGDRFRAAETYAQWGRRFSSVIGEALPCSENMRRRRRAHDEARRQESLDRVKILGTSPEERFDQIAQSARSTFGAAAATIAFLDHDRQWFKAREGVSVEEIPRKHAVCDLTIASDGVFTIPNMLDDPRFAKNPYVTGPEHVRFYAGYRIEAPDGQPIGALCIFDTRPREFSAQESVLLRELALMAQDEVWAGRTAELAG